MEYIESSRLCKNCKWAKDPDEPYLKNSREHRETLKFLQCASPFVKTYVNSVTGTVYTNYADSIRARDCGREGRFYAPSRSREEELREQTGERLVEQRLKDEFKTNKMFLEFVNTCFTQHVNEKSKTAKELDRELKLSPITDLGAIERFSVFEVPSNLNIDVNWIFIITFTPTEQAPCQILMEDNELEPGRKTLTVSEGGYLATCMKNPDSFPEDLLRYCYKDEDSN